LGKDVVVIVKDPVIEAGIVMVAACDFVGSSTDVAVKVTMRLLAEGFDAAV